MWPNLQETFIEEILDGNLHFLCSAIEKEVTRIHKKWRRNYRKYILLQFVDDVRFMANSSSNLVNNLSEGIHRVKCKYGLDDKKMWNLWN